MDHDARSDAPGGASESEVRETFEAFYRREWPLVLALAWSLTGDRPVAEEVAQEAFQATHSRWSSLENPAGWVRAVVANRARSWVRRRGRERKALVRLALTPSEPVVSEDVVAFWDIVRRLPRRQAQCLALHYLEDQTAAEIGGILGCAEATVRKHLSRGRRTLAERLGLDVEVTDGP
jgi:RNA polymerase sigma-70 factor (ECF subfamily)